MAVLYTVDSYKPTLYCLYNIYKHGVDGLQQAAGKSRLQTQVINKNDREMETVKVRCWSICAYVQLGAWHREGSRLCIYGVRRRGAQAKSGPLP